MGNKLVTISDTHYGAYLTMQIGSCYSYGIDNNWNITSPSSTFSYLTSIWKWNGSSWQETSLYNGGTWNWNALWAEMPFLKGVRIWTRDINANVWRSRNFFRLDEHSYYNSSSDYCIKFNECTINGDADYVLGYDQNLILFKDNNYIRIVTGNSG